METSVKDLKATKRSILSVSSRLFDALGQLCPIGIKSKILLQELWIQKLSWDESISMSLNTIWENLKSNLIEIPRFVQTTSTTNIMRAYGCCICVRSFECGIVTARLLTEKSKVAPLKKKPLLSLEMCAAHLLAKLWTRIKLMFEFKIVQV